MSANPAQAAEPRPPADEAKMRAALAWETGQQPADDKSTWVWLWESIQGDFNDKRSTGQIAFDAAVSMLPLVDQICDVRDIIANSRAIAQSDAKDDNTWKWVAVALTLIGLIPTVGSALKGVLKIVFTFVRREGMKQLEKAIDLGMTWVITFLRKREVQAYLRKRNVDEVFGWLAKEIRAFQPKVNTQALLGAFDDVIAATKALLDKVTWLPAVGAKAKQAIVTMERVRQMAPQPLAKVDEMLQTILGAIARRMDKEHLLQRHGILNTHNVHFRGTLPEAQAVSLMRKADPLPPWLSKGTDVTFPGLKPKLERPLVDASVKRGYPPLTDGNIASFHRLAPDEIVGPAKLYRVGSPSSGAMGDCWVSEKVFNDIMSSPDPKTAWRKYLAVWPDWNANGQFFVHEIPAGQKLKVWRGETSSQAKDPLIGLDAHLEGGWEQVVFKPTKDNGVQHDTMRYYRRGGKDEHRLQRPLSREEFNKLPKVQQAEYTQMREKINDPHTKGPFDTHWGMTDFDQQLNDARIGLPTLPGQVTKQ